MIFRLTEVIVKQNIKLKNNMQLIYDDIASGHRVTLSVLFRCGAFYETSKNRGITHLVEHLFFRRLNGIPQKELYFKTESIGGTLNGSTYRDFVRFDISVIPEYFTAAFDIISQILCDFDWSLDDVKREKRVVENQILFKSESYDEYAERMYFGNAKYAIPIMGNKESVENLKLSEINAYKKKYFNCDNSCFVITGAFSREQLDYAVKGLEKIDNSGVKASEKTVYPKEFAARTPDADKIIPSDCDISDVCIAFDVPIGRVNIGCVQMLSSILGEGVGSRLSYSLIDCNALTDLITSCINFYNGFANILIEYSVLNELLEKSLLEVFEQISDIKQNLSETDYLSSVTFFTKGLITQKDDPKELNFNYGVFDWLFGIEYDLSKQAKQNENISVEDLQKTAKEIFVPHNLKIIITNNSKIVKKSALKALLVSIRERLQTC